ncbi:MAG: BamA/TamA family outer membrane protein [Cytophagales bacterium]|nr:BamA/TamA family outer membrane protein [Cytophagales bacterium]
MTKYFFSGGSNSNRAWPTRRLGPGSYGSYNSNPEADGLVNYSFEQPGEFLLETSLELRQKLIGFFDGALFVDAGNVWTLQRDDSRPGANLSTNSLKKLHWAPG